MFDTECGRGVGKIQERRRLWIYYLGARESGVILYHSPPTQVQQFRRLWYLAQKQLDEFRSVTQKNFHKHHEPSAEYLMASPRMERLSKLTT